MSLTPALALTSQTEDTTGTISHTTAAFTPPDSCILVAHCGVVNGAGVSDVRTGMTLSGGGLTWTKRAGPNPGLVGTYTSCHEVWTAPVVTGASMTITYSHAGNVGSDRSRATIQVHSFISGTTAPEIGTPNTASGAHDQGDAGVTITLGSAPASSSIVSASRYYSSNGFDPNATPGTGWTELADTTYNGYGALQSQYRGSSTSTSVVWNDVSTLAETAWNSSAMAIEVKEAAGGANPHYVFGHPLNGPFAGPIG